MWGGRNFALRLGSIYGIPLYLDYSFFIIVGLIVWTFGFGYIAVLYPHLSPWTYLSLGLLFSLLVLVSIVVHELAHSIVAKRNGLRIGRITIYLLGGVSEMTEEPPNPSLELRMSAAGPIVSLVIAGISFALWIVLASIGASPLLYDTLEYCFVFNLIVSAFNLIPAFPMDGGRIMRSIFWKFNNDLVRSTKTASNIGRGFAYVMMFGGILLALLYPAYILDGLWLVFIGWFISTAAQSEYNQVIVMRDLADLKARDMMTRTVDKVAPEITLSELNAMFSQYKHNGFPVMAGEELIGCVTMRDLRRIKKEFWETTRVEDIMTPKEKLVTAKANDPARDVLTIMSKNQIGRLFVVSDDTPLKLIGIITRTDIMRTIQMQESYLKGREAISSPGSERQISVEVGMLFELVSPREFGVNTAAEFGNSDFSLVSQRIVQLPPDKETREFTFQALRKGRFSITLVQGTGTSDKRGSSVEYDIIVS